MINILKALANRYLRYTKEQSIELYQRAQLSRAHNSKLKTRSLERRRLFLLEFNRVTEEFGGELRKYRRRMAKARARRAWIIHLWIA